MSANLLAQETSPYLLQHKDNPVHWRAWSPEALAEAKRFKKPILLSVGYAACHWCHVMAHESFEDPQTAQVMNDLFVPIKVDREERPDIDTIYQSALALIGEQGGWPLTMFLTPGRRAVLGRHLFSARAALRPPRLPRHPGESLRGLSQPARRGGAERRQPARGARQARGFAKGRADSGDPGRSHRRPYAAAVRCGARRPRHRAEVSPRQPLRADVARFPAHRQHAIPRHRHAQPRQDEPGRHLRSSRRRLRALLHRPVLARAAFRKDALRQCADDRHPDAGLAGDALAALRRAHRRNHRLGAARDDRPSDGAAGSPRRSMRTAKASRENSMSGAKPRSTPCSARTRPRVFKGYYDVRPGGNWEGHTILNRTHRPQWPDEATETRLADARRKLLAARDKRVRPGWDDKVLADWNGLMIAAMANAGAVFEREDWVAAAMRAFDFVARKHERRRQGQWASGAQPARRQRSAAPACSTTMPRWRAPPSCCTRSPARRAISTMPRPGWARSTRISGTPENGGYFFTADDAEGLIVRTRNAHDNATPSGNGVMAGVLARLFYVTGKDAYRARAEALDLRLRRRDRAQFFPAADPAQQQPAAAARGAGRARRRGRTIRPWRRCSRPFMVCPCRTVSSW